MSKDYDDNSRAMMGLLNLEIDGERADGRTQAARTFKRIAADLNEQMARQPKASEQLLLRNAATFAYLCDRDTARLMAGQSIDEENHRRNAQALGGVLIKLGMAAKSRDVTKKAQQATSNPFADAIEASYTVVAT